MSSDLISSKHNRSLKTIVSAFSDISEAELRLQAIIKTTSECVKILDSQGRLLQINEAGLRMIEADNEEQVLGKNVFHIIADSCRDSWVAMHERVCRGESLSWQYQITGLKGTSRWMETHATPFILTDGSVGHLAVARDVTNKKITEEKLQDTLDQMKVIFESVGDAILVQDKNYRCIYANEVAAKKCGYSSVQEFLYKPVEDSLKNAEIFTESGEAFPIERLTARQVLRGKDHAEEVYYIRDSLANTQQITKSSSRAIRNAKGEVTHAVTVFRDITSEKKTEDRTKFLADVSKVFSTSLDYKQTLRSLGELIVPSKADWFSVDLLNESGELEAALVTHRDAEKIDLAINLRKKYPLRKDGVIYKTLRTGEPGLIQDISEKTYKRGAFNEEHLAMLNDLAITSLLVVPIKLRDQVVGVMTLCQSRFNRKFAQEDKALMCDVAERAAPAIESARLYEEAQAEKTKLKLAIDAAKLGIFEWNVSENNVELSTRATQILDFSEQHITSEELLGRIYTEDLAYTQNILNHAIEEVSDFSFEVRVKLPDNSIHWILCYGHVEFNRELKSIRVIGTIKDTTWRKEAELNQSKINRLQQIAGLLSNKLTPHEIAETVLSEGLPAIEADAGVVALYDEKEDELNVIFSQGYSQESLNLISCLRLDVNVPLAETFRTKKPIVLKSNREILNAYSYLAQIPHIENRKAMTAFPLIAHGRVLGAISLSFNTTQDFSKNLINYIQTLADHAAQAIDRALIFEESQEARKRADMANRAKSSFLANMSHEIRTPMNAILGFSKLLQEPTLSPNEKEDFLKRIQVNGDHLLHLIDDILDLSKVEAGLLRLDFQMFSLRKLINEVYEDLAVLCHEKAIKPRLIYDDNVPENIYSDFVRLKQVLMNLVSNAVKFTSVGGVTIVVSMDPDRNCINFEVNDTGHGISDESREQLFKSFSQGDMSITRKYGGTGLGLYLSRKLIELLGGSLELITTEIGKGSTFRASAPITAGVGFTSSGRKENVKTQLNRSGTLKVLLADDSVDNRTLIEYYLRNQGVELHMATNGQEAIQKVSEIDFDLILMDVQMPELDGLEATRKLRAQGFKKPIVALTAHAMHEEIQKSLNAGCTLHLTKPISRSSLLEGIEEALEKVDK